MNVQIRRSILLIFVSNEIMHVMKFKCYSNLIICIYFKITGIDTDSSLGLRKSATEFISLDEPHAVPGPQIPFAVHHHCMVQLDSKSIFIIGGYQNGVKSDKTWVVDPTNNYQVKEGPTMKTVKWVHSCAKMKIKEKTILVVVGNTLDGDLEDLVELLDTSVPDPKWTIGI